VSDPFAALSPAERALLRRAPRPRSVTPMKAILIDRPFSAEGWIFERKLDGIRCIAIRGGDQVRLLSRNALSLNARYPELVDAVGREPARDFVIDGEVVAFEGSRTSFARLAQRNRLRDPRDPSRSAVRVYLYVFDLLYLEGYDTTRVPLRGRKAVLRRALKFGDGLRFTTHRNREGERYFRDACRRRWEGLIAKRADSAYRSTRSRDWLKLKCEHEQELVIGGFTAPRGSRTGFGALLLGYHRGDQLVYAGKVGTGFDTATLEWLGRRLRRLRRSSSPFAGDDAPAKGTTWVEPKLVAQVGFTEWTRDGRLRHPRFLGLRDDKDPREVVRE
jgi:bifunctional non-homologous end joining protein LigD